MKNLNLSGPDGGPMYMETDLSRLVAEPFNGITAAFFLFLAIFWLYRLRGRYREQWLLTTCLLILAVGGIGGAMFHAFRSSRIFFLMDVMPIGVLVIVVSVQFWLRIFSSRLSVVLVTLSRSTVPSSRVFFAKKPYWDRDSPRRFFPQALLACLGLHQSYR
ncbi:MAG: hypothetical protein R3B54_06295 [Bdellovibrionota bacterium]